MLTTLRDLTSDGWLLFATRSIRLFAYGGLSVVLVFYLVSLGLTESDVGLLLTVTLLGDTLISLILTTQADRIGRRRMLIVGAALMAAAGLVFGFTARFWLLVIAGTIGVISPSGQEVGPFLSIEQAAVAGRVRSRTNECLRLVHDGRFTCDSARCPRRQRADAGAADVLGTGRQSSRNRHCVQRGALLSAARAVQRPAVRTFTPFEVSARDRSVPCQAAVPMPPGSLR